MVCFRTVPLLATPLRGVAAGEQEVRLVHEGRGLERVPHTLVAHVAGGHRVQLVVDEREQTGPCGFITVARGLQDPGKFVVVLDATILRGQKRRQGPFCL